MRPPKPDLLDALDGVERLAYRLGEACAGPLKPVASAWNLSFTSMAAWLCICRRLNVEGLENIAHLHRGSRVLLVANHRSFFDFFVVSAATVWKSPIPRRRTFFPVRSSFFYDRPLGIAVNALTSGMSMFPPIFRERSKHSFNKYALERCVEELSIPGTVVGLHPEGTRNKGEDPYALLPPKAGMGKIALRAGPDVEVIPVFVLGMTNDLRGEVAKNWRAPSEHPINVVIGPRIDLSDLRERRAGETEQTLHGLAARRCIDALAGLAGVERGMRGLPPRQALKAA